MNRNQKKAVLIGFTVLALMVLYPPWTYSWFGIGPRPPLPPGMLGVPEVKKKGYTYAPILNPPDRWEIRLNIKRLLLQCSAVVAITGYGVFRLRD
jgi:hypothetical protein